MLSLRQPRRNPLARALARVLVAALLAGLVPVPAWASRGHDVASPPLSEPLASEREAVLLRVVMAVATSPVTIDADGNRLQTTTTPPGQAPQVVNYLVDTSGSLSQVVAETGGTANLTAYYLRGDDLLSVMRPAGTGFTTRFYHPDGLGSIRRLTDEAGTITDGNTYSAFGELLAHTGSDQQPYTFAGEPYDPNSGFSYNRARWMDPRVGRFAGMDPLPAFDEMPSSLNRFSYVLNRPVDLNDPSGQWPPAIHGMLYRFTF